MKEAVKNLPAMQEPEKTQVRSLSREDPLEDRRGRQKEGEKEEARKAGEEEQSGSERGEGLEEAASPWAGPGQSPGRPPPGIGETKGWGGAEVPWGGVSCARACEWVRAGLGD